jgi:hypothetical protein
MFVTEFYSGTQNRKIRWAKIWRLQYVEKRNFYRFLVRQPERKRSNVRPKFTFEMYVVLDKSERLATDRTEITFV